MKKSIIKMSAMAFAFFALTASTIQAQDAPTAAGTYNDGLAQLKAKDYENGLMNMEKALELATADENEQIIGLAKKNGAIAAYNVGNAKRKAKAYDEAMSYYNKGIELSPSYSSNYEGIARVHEDKGDKVEAVKAYIVAAQKAEETDDAKKAVSRYKKAEVLTGKTYVGKDYTTAIEMAKAYTAAKQDNAEVYYYLSRSQAAAGSGDDAIASMEMAISKSGDAVPDKYTFYLAEQLEKAGKNAEAAAAYRKVTEEKYKAQAEYRAGQLGG